MERANVCQVKNDLIVQAASGPLPWPLRLLGLAWTGLALALVLTFWQDPYLLNLASPFRVHLLGALVVLSVPLAVFFPHRNRWIFIALPLVVSVTFAPYFRTDRSAGSQIGGSVDLTLVTANLYSGNHDLARFRDWLATDPPDVVGLVEVSEGQRAQLESLPFAYKSLHPREGNFGIGLLCQRAPTEVAILEEESPFPSLLATWPEYRILLTHPMPPISKSARAVGDAQMSRLVKALNTAETPLIVMGDLNATGWDARLRPLREADLRETRLGQGILPTWPTDRPWLGIPIDHIFIPKWWQTLETRVGPDIGSDHFPLLSEVRYAISAVSPPRSL